MAEEKTVEVMVEIEKTVQLEEKAVYVHEEVLDVEKIMDRTGWYGYKAFDEDRSKRKLYCLSLFCIASKRKKK